MKSYKCHICDFSAKLKTDFNRHLNTNKHTKNKRAQGGELDKLCKNYSKFPPKPSEINSKSIQNKKKYMYVTNVERNSRGKII